MFLFAVNDRDWPNGRYLITNFALRQLLAESVFSLFKLSALSGHSDHLSS
jgi:hypothetical protein